MATVNLSVSRGKLLILDGKPKFYEVYEQIATKLDINPQMTCSANF